jgi:hypothetical protein
MGRFYLASDYVGNLGKRTLGVSVGIQLVPVSR